MAVGAGIAVIKFGFWWHKNKPIKAWRQAKRSKKKLEEFRQRLIDEGIDPEGIEMNPLATQILLMAVRHGLGLLGGAGLFSGDEITAFAGAIAATVAVIWSAYRKIKRAKEEG